jgi:hypothetical protein
MRDREIGREDYGVVIREDEGKKRPPCGGLSGGPSRDRTDDLSDAIRTLSQLSYGPAQPRQCSPELVLTGPADPEQLVVPRGQQPEVNLPVRDNLVRRQEVALLSVLTVEPEGVELAEFVTPIDEPFGTTTACVQTSENDVPYPDDPLALDTQENRA